MQGRHSSLICARQRLRSCKNRQDQSDRPGGRKESAHAVSPCLGSIPLAHCPQKPPRRVPKDLSHRTQMAWLSGRLYDPRRAIPRARMLRARCGARGAPAENLQPQSHLRSPIFRGFGRFRFLSMESGRGAPHPPGYFSSCMGLLWIPNPAWKPQNSFHSDHRPSSPSPGDISIELKTGDISNES
jgi:hypothetical protein